MTSVLGHLEDGTVRLNESVDWAEGQEVLVIALPGHLAESPETPAELLEEDAREFAPRRETLSGVNRRELP
jgi:hypothetical protein